MLLTKKEINSIVKKIEKNIEINIQGQHDKALNSYLELWESLPEPKQEQPEQISNWLINCIFNNYFDRESFLEAKKWAEKALNNDTAETGAYEHFQMGRVCYELNEFDEAMKYFEIAYQRGKKRAFQEFDKKYWEFYSKK